MPVEYQGISLSSIFSFRGFGRYCVLFGDEDPFYRLLTPFSLIPTTKYAKTNREKRSEFAKIY